MLTATLQYAHRPFAKTSSRLADTMAGATLAAGRGPLLLGLTWTWTTIATFLFILRAVNASKAPKEHKNLFGLRLDFCWVTLAYVSEQRSSASAVLIVTRSPPYPLKSS